MADFYLDCKGQQCPKPIVQVSKQMARMGVGQTLLVEATDAAFSSDLNAWLEMRQQKLVEFDSGGPFASAVLEKC
jgi:tRNA 2-thiouridine synthesizing protein A